MLALERRRRIAADVVSEYVDELTATGTPGVVAELLGVLLWAELIGVPGEA